MALADIVGSSIIFCIIVIVIVVDVAVNVSVVDAFTTTRVGYGSIYLAEAALELERRENYTPFREGGGGRDWRGSGAKMVGIPVEGLVEPWLVWMPPVCSAATVAADSKPNDARG